eukprot:g72648.t1
MGKREFFLCFFFLLGVFLLPFWWSFSTPLSRPQFTSENTEASASARQLASLLRGELSADTTELRLTGLGLRLEDAAVWRALGGLTQLTVLDLSNNLLTDLPDSLEKLSSLRILFVSKNKLESMPAVLGRLSGLAMLSLRDNALRALPKRSVSAGVSWLILTNNQLSALPGGWSSCLLSALPGWLGQLSGLRKLMLAHNRLTSLPPELARCQELELVRLSDNRLTSPSALLSILSQLPKLRWVALSDAFANASAWPAAPPAAAGLPWLDARSLHIAQLPLLGKGASGNVYRTEHQGQPAALKVYNTMSSDGLAGAELAVCAAVGRHENIVAFWAASKEPHSLLMELLNNYSSLGAVPSFSSVTRDTFVLQQHALHVGPALAIAQQVARALEHLHSRHIAHGDVYAHNVQVSAGCRAPSLGRCTAKLGDFGAAFFYDPVAHPLFYVLELRAFGCLLQDLSGLLVDSASGGSDLEVHHSAAASVQHVRGGVERLGARCRNASFADTSTRQPIHAGSATAEAQADSGPHGPGALTFTSLADELATLLHT